MLLEFIKRGETIMALELDDTPGSSPRLTKGNDDWFDYNFRPYSKTLGAPVASIDNPREYALALAQSYIDNNSAVRLKVTDSTEEIVSPNLPPEPPIAGQETAQNRDIAGLPDGPAQADRFEGMVLSGWWRRVGALLLDNIFIFLIVALLAIIFFPIFGLRLEMFEENYSYTDSEEMRLIFYVLGLIFSMFLTQVLYFGLTMMRRGKHNGQTWGKQIFSITVIKEKGLEMGFWFAILRQIVVINWLFGIPSQVLYGIPSLLDYLWATWDKGHQCLHDKIVKTRVVRVDIK